MKKLAALSSLISVFLSFPAFSGSRVGNKTISDPTLGYSMEIPSAFCEQDHCVSQVSSDGSAVQLFNDSQMTLWVPELGSQKPKLIIGTPAFKGFSVDSRQQIVLRLQQLSAHKIATKNPCLELWKTTDQGLFHFVAIWGKGKGIEISGFDIATLSESAEMMTATIQLTPGACVW